MIITGWINVDDIKPDFDITSFRALIASEENAKKLYSHHFSIDIELDDYNIVSSEKHSWRDDVKIVHFQRKQICFSPQNERRIDPEL